MTTATISGLSVGDEILGAIENIVISIPNRSGSHIA